MIDEPIVVTGGSVKVAISEKFKNDGHDRGKNKYKLDDRRLVAIKVNGTKVHDLNQGDEVTFVCDDAPAAPEAIPPGGLGEASPDAP
jgi:hypothetical protein